MKKITALIKAQIERFKKWWNHTHVSKQFDNCEESTFDELYDDESLDKLYDDSYELFDELYYDELYYDESYDDCENLDKRCTNNSTWYENLFIRTITKILKVARNFILTGLIFNIVAAHFYPGFPERFPIIYGWFDGWLQLGEFGIICVLNFIYLLFTGGDLIEFFTSSTESLNELIVQFLNWLSLIHF